MPPMKPARVKPGLVVTLIICVAIIAFRVQFLETMVALSVMIAGKSSPCPFRNAIGSFALIRRQAERADILQREARLVERDSAGYELYEIAGRQIWMPAGSLWGVAWDSAEQERGIYKHVQGGVARGDVVLDGGANIGLFTWEALKLGARQVIAIEPVPANLECLRRNLKREIAEGRVVLYPKGVWDRDDVLEMNIDQSNQTGDSFVLNAGGGAVRVKLPLTTVDALVAELGLEKVDFIKMDVEGAERKALQGAAETIRRFHPRMAIAAYHLSDDNEVIPTVVRSLSTSYRQELGPCRCVAGSIDPEIHFYF
jgi:FkbM family methyltransferase